MRARSKRAPAALETRPLERRPRFLEVPGLVQKVCGTDEATGDVCGICFFEDEDALAAFRRTELARTIPSAHDVEEMRLEAYEAMYPLHPDRGPVREELSGA